MQAVLIAVDHSSSQATPCAWALSAIHDVFVVQACTILCAMLLYVVACGARRCLGPAACRKLLVVHYQPGVLCWYL